MYDLMLALDIDDNIEHLHYDKVIECSESGLLFKELNAQAAIVCF